MSPELAREILEYAYAENKPLYRATLAAVAEAKKVRPVFYERKPRAERHGEMLAILSRPRMEPAAAGLIRTWLLKAQLPMLTDFLGSLDIPHKEGVVETFPDKVEDAKLVESIELLLTKHAREKVAVYLNAFNAMNETSWQNLSDLLQKEPRLQLA